MATTKKKDTGIKFESNLGNFEFSKQNYTILFIGIAVNILGFILMIGGGSDDPNVFYEDKLFNFQRIVLSPFLVILGYVIIGYAIMKNPFKGKGQTPEEQI